VRRLEERLGRPGDAAYTLSLSLQTREEGLGIDPDGNTDRFNVIGVAGYVLSDRAGTQLASGTVNSFTGFSATGNTAVTLAAQRDARERLMVILADQITARLLAAPLPA
jgi:LPS-assembly lipoprotein